MTVLHAIGALFVFALIIFGVICAKDAAEGQPFPWQRKPVSPPVNDANPNPAPTASGGDAPHQDPHAEHKA